MMRQVDLYVARGGGTKYGFVFMDHVFIACFASRPFCFCTSEAVHTGLVLRRTM